MTKFSRIAAVTLALILPGFCAEAPPVLALGAALPDFSLLGTDGKTHTPADSQQAKLLCLIFTSNHCPDAVAAAGRMQQLHVDYKDKGVAVVAVSGNNPGALTPDELGYSPFSDSYEEMTPFAKDFGWTFPYLYDGDKQLLTTACGGQSTPHVFVFDAARKLRYTGRMDDAERDPAPVAKSYVRDALDSLLAGTEVKEPVTRSFGCSTKWLSKKANVARDQAAWEKLPVTVADLDEALAKKLRSNTAGNLRLINFWSTTCGPCIKEFPGLVDLGRRFQTRSVEFISISVDPAAARPAVEKFLTAQHAATPTSIAASFAKDGRTTNNFQWTGGNPDVLARAIDAEWSGALPHTVLVAPGGEIVWRHSGEIDIVEARRQVLKQVK